MKKSYTADPHLAAALEQCFIGTHSKQPQSEVVEGKKVPEISLPQCLHENKSWTP
jgi:hypothetical protein